jgi:site-specific DNA-methyltransferase (adenine-specific)
MSDSIQLYLGDCLEVMSQIPNESVDCIICDLPYGTTACSWDAIIPFEDLWKEYKRITKSNAPIVLFGSQPFTTVMINSNLAMFREELIWLKNKAGSGFGVNQRHQKIHENIEVFAKNGTYTYNPQKWLIAEKEFITQRKTFRENENVGNNIYGKMQRTRKVDTGERNPLSIVSCRVPFTPQKTKTYADDVDLRMHPTQKPLELVAYLVKTFSNPNDVVLDNCMGSGTTGVACKKLGRHFIGIEQNKDYFDIAKERIGKVNYAET